MVCCIVFMAKLGLGIIIRSVTSFQISVPSEKMSKLLLCQPSDRNSGEDSKTVVLTKTM